MARIVRCVFVLFSFLLLQGCPSDPTQIVVVVASDMWVGVEVDALRVRTLDSRGATLSTRDVRLGTSAGDFGLPGSFGIAPRDADTSRSIRLEVDALRLGCTLFTYRATTGFARGRTVRLDVFLARACGVTLTGPVCPVPRELCGDADFLTCAENGSCVPVRRPPDSLPDFSPDASTATRDVVTPPNDIAGDETFVPDTDALATDVTQTDDSQFDAVPLDEAPYCASTIPTDNFCGQSGCNVAPFTLPRCDHDENEYAFYGSLAPSLDYCEANVTVVNLIAAWCPPCRSELPYIERDISRAYAGRGVRVIHVLQQNADYTEPTRAECALWQQGFTIGGQRYEVTGVMTYDPAGILGRFNPSNAFPCHFVIDRHGRLRYLEYNYGGIGDVIPVIDEILAEP